MVFQDEPGGAAATIARSGPGPRSGLPGQPQRLPALDPLARGDPAGGLERGGGAASERMLRLRTPARAATFRALASFSLADRRKRAGSGLCRTGGGGASGGLSALPPFGDLD